jgi:hypothetical protein
MIHVTDAVAACRRDGYDAAVEGHRLYVRRAGANQVVASMLVDEYDCVSRHALKSALDAPAGTAD